MFKAENKSELIKILSEIDISVSRRGPDRTSDHTERYALAHLLSVLAQKDSLVYPLFLMHSDRPDFLLTMQNKQVGIEHTEAVSDNEAHKQVLRTEGNGPGVYFISRVIPGEPKKKRKEILGEIEQNDPGSGWSGGLFHDDYPRASRVPRGLYEFNLCVLCALCG